MPRQYEAVFFDFDGVLVDSEPIHYECWSEIMEPYGVRIGWEAYQKECIGVSEKEIVRRFCARMRPPGDFNQVWKVYPAKTDLFRRKMERDGVFRPPTLDLVKSLKHYKLAVVSSSGRSEVEPPLVRAGIRDCFETLVCGMEVPNLKPAPDPYLRAAELLNVRHPLVVEDSEAGIASGEAAGFDVLRIRHPSEVADRVREVLGAADPADC